VSKYPVHPAYADLPESDIIARCRQGDLEAFNVLISRYETRVLNLTLRYLRDYHQAVDETQEIFVKVFRKIGLFKGEAAFGTWLYRITSNHCFNVLKQKRSGFGDRQKMISLESAQQGRYPQVWQDARAPKPDEVLAQEELRQLLLELIEHLAPVQRQVIVLRHFEHLSYEEIAAIMELPVTTIRSCLFRARKRLRILLTKKRGKHREK